MTLCNPGPLESGILQIMYHDAFLNLGPGSEAMLCSIFGTYLVTGAIVKKIMVNSHKWLPLILPDVYSSGLSTTWQLGFAVRVRLFLYKLPK